MWRTDNKTRPTAAPIMMKNINQKEIATVVKVNPVLKNISQLMIEDKAKISMHNSTARDLAR